jgi:hypothetical protein
MQRESGMKLFTKDERQHSCRADLLNGSRHLNNSMKSTSNDQTRVHIGRFDASASGGKTGKISQFISKNRLNHLFH